MLSPEAFYNKEIKGKSPSQILSKIQELKKQIKPLHEQLESFEYEDDYPSAYQQLFLSGCT